MEPQPVAHVCCPGPSLDPDEVPDGWTVCINVAAATMRRCDVLVALGPPSNRTLATARPQIDAHAPLVVSMFDAADAWAAEGFRVARWEEKLTPEWYGKAWRGTYYSVWVALSVAFTYSSEVHIWGCDLRGRDYVWTPANATTIGRSERSMTLRWKNELDNFNRISRAAHKAGVDFHVHGAVENRLSRPEPGP